MQDAAGSVMSNIAEGFERGSEREFVRFLYMAKASAGEVRSQLYVASELSYIQPAEFAALKTRSEDVSKALSGFISYLSDQHTLQT